MNYSATFFQKDMANLLRAKIISGGIHTENRETFFRRISKIYATQSPEYILIEKAYYLAKEEFRGMTRDDGVRYFEHLRAVCIILIEIFHVRDPHAIIAAILHDGVEDRDWKYGRLKILFGETSPLFIEYLSKEKVVNMPGDTPEEQKANRDDSYYTRLWQAPKIVIMIKLADVLHNCWTLWDSSDKKKVAKIKQLALHFIPLARKHELPQLYLLEDAFTNLLKEVTS